MKWLKTLLRIVREYDQNFNDVVQFTQAQAQEVEAAKRYIKRATKVHFDVGFDMRSTVIVCGTYRGRDHVQVFNINPGDFAKLVDQMRETQKVATIGKLDMPHGLDVTVKRELKL